MTISLHDSDPKATELFGEAYEIVHAILPEAEIHHVGSTSVKELGGKGIIDILIAIPDWNQKENAGTKLQELGFLHIHKEVNNRIFMSRVGDTIKNDVHIHLTYIGSSEYKSFLSFRDYLRMNHEEANTYLKLKYEWLREAKGDRKIYTSSKNIYIASVLAKATSKEIIIEIKDIDFDKEYIGPSLSEYTPRHASRGILFKEGKVALLYVAKYNFHKLPGGGIEDGETSVEAFKREIKEETGCECEIDNETSNLITLEWRGKWQLFQTSYIFTAHVLGDPAKPSFTESELSEGFELRWVNFDQADKILAINETQNYDSQFIKLRDRAIINHYQKVYKINKA